jgi:hypothetical protein
MHINRNIYILLFLFLLADTAYSFLQHYHAAIDGDLAANVLHASDVDKIISDPLGLKVLLHNEVYPNPNRFFAHWTLSEYFRTFPFAFQKFTGAINSIYLSCALIKTIVQALLIFLIAVFVNIVMGKRNAKDLLLPAALVAPLFQANGYNRILGIIDPSITYTFFYAMPLCYIIPFFIPYFKAWIKGEQVKLSIFTRLALAVLLFIICFSGPLLTGIMLIVCPLVLLYSMRLNIARGNGSYLPKAFNAVRSIPKDVLFFFIAGCIMSLYSLYIGGRNVSNFTDTYTISLGERFARLPLGLFNILTQKPAFPLLLLAIGINAYIIKKHDTTKGKQLLFMIKCIGIFSLIYILLLPFGGFRSYRPNIVRYDTIMPVTVCLMFFFAASSCYLLSILTRRKTGYITGIIALLLIFSAVDNPSFRSNQCEKNALEEIARSTQDTVMLASDCTVMAWGPIKDPAASELNAELLQYWGVTEKKKLYYQPMGAGK